MSRCCGLERERVALAVLGCRGKGSWVGGGGGEPSVLRLL